MIWFWAALLVGGLALMTYALVGVLTGRTPRSSRAHRILDERYAAGELTTQEYEHRRAVLSQGGEQP